nr:uncharacterized protein LOC126545849 [Dermacentor andersoni]
MLNYAEQTRQIRGITGECPVPFGIEKNGGFLDCVGGGGGGGSSARAREEGAGGCVWHARRSVSAALSPEERNYAVAVRRSGGGTRRHEKNGAVGVATSVVRAAILRNGQPSSLGRERGDDRRDPACGQQVCATRGGGNRPRRGPQQVGPFPEDVGGEGGRERRVPSTRLHSRRHRMRGWQPYSHHRTEGRAEGGIHVPQRLLRPQHNVHLRRRHADPRRRRSATGVRPRRPRLENYVVASSVPGGGILPRPANTSSVTAATPWNHGS